MKRTLMKYAAFLCCVVVLSPISCIKNDKNPNSAVIDRCSGQPGPLFSAVKSLMSQKCFGCHNDNVANGGMIWTHDCNIISNQALIMQKAVIEGSMPPSRPLSQADKNKIIAWINSGGAISN